MLRLFDGVTPNVKLRLQPPHGFGGRPSVEISKVRLFFPRDDCSATAPGETAADGAKLFFWNAQTGDQDFGYLMARDSEDNWTAPIPVALK